MIIKESNYKIITILTRSYITTTGCAYKNVIASLIVKETVRAMGGVSNVTVI